MTLYNIGKRPGKEISDFMKKGVDKWGMEAYTNQVASRGAAATKENFEKHEKSC